MAKFTNKNRQMLCDLSKWLESKKEGYDKSGSMDYCEYCPYQKSFNCEVEHEERVANSFCAKAYNRMKKQK